MAKEEETPTQTGYTDDANSLTYYDAATGTYKTQDTSGMTFAEKMAFQNEQDLGYYENVNGDYVYGTEPASKYIPSDPSPGGRFDSGIYVEGENPYQPVNTGPTNGLTLGGGAPSGGGTTQPPVTTQPPPPTNNPMDPFDPDTGTGNPNNPTDDWFWTDPVGYENAPQPGGDGSFEEGRKIPPRDTSWNWDHFREKAPGDRQWGGYDEDYQAFERYQPGDRSPWGMPNIEGGNRDFYQQQFANQLRDEQGYQNRERTAQRARERAEKNPYEHLMDDAGSWDWAYGGKGLPEVTMGAGAPEQTFSRASQFSEDSTFGDMIRNFAGQEGFSPYQDAMRYWLNNHPQEGLDSTYWARAGDPNKIISSLGQGPEGLTGENRDWLTKMANAVWQPGALGPNAPAQYASPVQWGSEYNTPAPAPAA